MSTRALETRRTPVVAPAGTLSMMTRTRPRKIVLQMSENGNTYLSKGAHVLYQDAGQAVSQGRP